MARLAARAAAALLALAACAPPPAAGAQPPASLAGDALPAAPQALPFAPPLAECGLASQAISFFLRPREGAVDLYVSSRVPVASLSGSLDDCGGASLALVAAQGGALGELGFIAQVRPRPLKMAPTPLRPRCPLPPNPVAQFPPHPTLARITPSGAARRARGRGAGACAARAREPAP